MYFPKLCYSLAGWHIIAHSFFFFRCCVNMKLNEFLDCIRLLDLPLSTRSHCLVYYFALIEYGNHHKLPVTLDILAAASVHIACKQTYIQRKLRDVVNVFYYAIHTSDRYIELNKSFWNLKDTLVHAEYLVLRILNFDTEINDAYDHLVDCFQKLGSKTTSYTDTEYKLICQCSLTWLNDSLTCKSVRIFNK
ncbi:hypothetical protein BC833DRAFT_148165 [Globomyces pollinis-pini]|nr:hypothetical protein BC833DRAFT_148165 [Globomyces pollinis-pini]